MTNPEKGSDRTLAGKCLCGAVHYAVADEFVYAASCHCSNCRRATGSAFKPFAGIERDKLGITKGEENLMRFGDENANDTHCKTCGSFLYSVVRDGAFVHVTMGTLVDDPTIRPTEHIFVGTGDGPCLIFMTGGRTGEKSIVYPRSELALRHGAGVETETPTPAEAYAPFPTWQPGKPDFTGMPWAD